MSCGLVMFVVVTAAGMTRSTVLPLPIDAPRGFIEIASLGMAEVTPDMGSPVSVLEVRMTVINVADAAPWWFDLRNATVGINHGPRVHGLFVNSDLVTLPLVALTRGERHIIDFYFPAAAEPAEFDFVWRFTTATRSVETHVRFSRDDATSHVVDDSPLLGWGTSWWRDPTYRSSIYGSGVVSQPSYVVAVQSHHARYYLVKSIWW